MHYFVVQINDLHDLCAILWYKLITFMIYALFSFANKYNINDNNP
jgi:hypothetical protein